MRPKVVLTTMEMLMPHLPEPYCGANFKGGLGKLAGCFMGGMPDVEIDCIGFVPLYHRAWFNPGIELDYGRLNVPLLCTIPAHFENQQFSVKVWNIARNGQPIFGLESDAFSVLYVEDRRKRLIQEKVFAQVVPQVLRYLQFRPDVLWLNESHTALTLPLFRNDPFFSGTKALFTIHTPEMAGMEKFYDFRVDSLDIPPKDKQAFVHDNVIDLTFAAMQLADMVNGVSEEHGNITRAMFHDFESKITHVTNGVDSRFWRHPELSALMRHGGHPGTSVLMNFHHRARAESLNLANELNHNMNGIDIPLTPNKPTAWFVRRFAAYKNLFPFLVNILPVICANRSTTVWIKIGEDYHELKGLGMQVVGAGRAAETDNECLGWMSEFTRMARNDLAGKFAFFSEYNLQTLQAGTRGADVWLVTPKPGREACGTSDRDAAMNGIPSIASRTGGMMEWMEEFNPTAGNGNGFFIDPYNPLTLYEKLRAFSDIWYAWFERRNTGPYRKLVSNVLAKSPELDIRRALEKYRELFLKLMKK